MLHISQLPQQIYQPDFRKGNAVKTSSQTTSAVGYFEGCFIKTGASAMR